MYFWTYHIPQAYKEGTILKNWGILTHISNYIFFTFSWIISASPATPHLQLNIFTMILSGRSLMGPYFSIPEMKAILNLLQITQVSDISLNNQMTASNPEKAAIKTMGMCILNASLHYKYFFIVFFGLVQVSCGKQQKNLGQC